MSPRRGLCLAGEDDEAGTRHNGARVLLACTACGCPRCLLSGSLLVSKEIHTKLLHQCPMQATTAATTVMCSLSVSAKRHQNQGGIQHARVAGLWLRPAPRRSEPAPQTSRRSWSTAEGGAGGVGTAAEGGVAAAEGAARGTTAAVPEAARTNECSRRPVDLRMHSCV